MSILGTSIKDVRKFSTFSFRFPPSDVSKFTKAIFSAASMTRVLTLTILQFYLTTNDDFMYSVHSFALIVHYFYFNCSSNQMHLRRETTARARAKSGAG